MAYILSLPERITAPRRPRMAQQGARSLVRRPAVSGLGDDALRARGGIFRHDEPRYEYESMDTSAYNNGSLGLEETELVDQVRRLTIVVGCTGLLLAGFLFNQMLQQARGR